MAARPKFFTLRKHLKKSIFAACLALYGGYYASGKYREYLVRREFCSEASKIGEEPISALQKPRCMYVFLNPQANDGKALKLYEKNVAPILHLAGIDVTLIKTDYEGHGKSLPGYMDTNTDGIVIAGGSGTLMEVVTGMIRLQDEETVSRIPIGLVPLGRTNGFFRSFYNSAALDAKSMGDATMAIVKGNTKTADVLEIASEGVRSTFALSGLNWGLFQQVKTKINAKKHWWAGPWKKQMAFITRTVKNWPYQFYGSMICEGVNKDKGVRDRDSSVIQNKDDNEFAEHRNSFKVFEENGVIQLKEIEDVGNSSDIGKTTLETETADLNGDIAHQDENSHLPSSSLKTSGININFERTDEPSKLCVQIWNPDINRLDFVSDGSKWIESNYGKVETDNCSSILCDEVNLQPSTEELTWYSIDGEEFEAKPVKIRIHRDKLKFFC